LLLGFVAVPQVAYACSDDPADPFNPNTAAFIAEGWVERATLRPDLADYANYTPVEVVMRVERTLKGSAPERVTFVDYGSAWQRPDGSVHWGAGGTCGILEADPTGKYALIVFGRWPDGRLLVNKIFGATFGGGPDDPQVEQLRQRLFLRLQPGTMPRAGDGAVGMKAGDRMSWLAACGALVIGGLLLQRRIKRPRSEASTYLEK